MAKYMILIYGDPEQWDAMRADESERHHAAHRAFAAKAGTRIVEGAQLEFPSAARTLLTNRSGGVAITDGPFVETKETIGGFYLLDAGDLDEASELAGMLPEVQAGHSGVEIRPVVDHG